MLLDPRTFIDYPIQILALLAVIILGKPAAAAGIVLVLRRPMSTAFVVGPALAQIGEFSFILAVLGRELGIIPDSAQQLIIAAAVLTIPLNGAVMTFGERLGQTLGASFRHPAAKVGLATSPAVMVLATQVVPTEEPGEFVA
jgi:CPA2 family monovalent cation:H+ antiporter-2